MSRLCKFCYDPVEEHEIVLGRRQCKMILIKDRQLSDGSGRTITVEGFPEDFPRTKENNLRWVHERHSPFK
jgi:hypothetical protein